MHFSDQHWWMACAVKVTGVTPFCVTESYDVWTYTSFSFTAQCHDVILYGLFFNYTFKWILCRMGLGLLFTLWIPPLITGQPSWVPEKLHCANIIHNLPIIMAVMQNHDNNQESCCMLKITVFMVIMIFLQPYSLPSHTCVTAGLYAVVKYTAYSK